MKETLRKILNAVLMIVVAVFIASIPGMQTQAANLQTVNSQYQGKELQYVICNDNVYRYCDDWKVISVKSSNQSVVTTKIVNELPSTLEESLGIYAGQGQNYAICTAKKPGKAIITYKVKVSGKTYTYKIKWTITKYANPFSSLKIGTQEYKALFAKSKYQNISNSKNKQKLRIKVKKGYKVSMIRVYYRAKFWVKNNRTGDYVKNNSKIDMKNVDSLCITVYDKKNKVSSSYWLNNN